MIKKYIGKLYCKSLAFNLGIFLFLFTVIDLFSSEKVRSLHIEFLSSLSLSVNSLDTMIAFIAFISCISFVIKLKSKSQEIALLCFGFSPLKIFIIVDIISISFYLIYQIFLQPASFALTRYIDQISYYKDGVKCKGKYTTYSNEKNDMFAINKLTYNLCSNNYVEYMENIVVNKKDGNIITSIYKDSKPENVIEHLFLGNAVYNIKNYTLPSKEEVVRIAEIETYKQEINSSQIPIYHILYTYFYQKGDIVRFTDIMNLLSQKMKIILFMIVMIHSCHIILLTNKRSLNVIKYTIISIAVMQCYYITSYTYWVKANYLDSTMLKLATQYIPQLAIIYYILYLQEKCILSISEICKPKNIIRKVLAFSKLYKKVFFALKQKRAT